MARAVPGSTRERILPEKRKMVWWGGEACAWVEIVLKSVLLLSRNIQERKRMKHSYRLTGLIAQLSLSPSTVQAELQKPDLRVLSKSFPFPVRNISQLSGKS